VRGDAAETGLQSGNGRIRQPEARGRACAAVVAGRGPELAMGFHMRFRNFLIAYAFLSALLLFAIRSPAPRPQNRYSQVIDLTVPRLVKMGSKARAGTRIISPAALVPGAWGAAQIPVERLIGPLVAMDLNASSTPISVEDIATWEAVHGNVPQGAIIAVRRLKSARGSAADSFPVSAEAAQFLMEARDTRGFIIETAASLGSHRQISRQIALHGNYVIERSAGLAGLPVTGTLIIVAPGKNSRAAETPVRVLAMVG
jgi:kynurenine formamidase